MKQEDWRFELIRQDFTRHNGVISKYWYIKTPNNASRMVSIDEYRIHVETGSALSTNYCKKESYNHRSLSSKSYECLGRFRTAQECLDLMESIELLEGG